AGVQMSEAVVRVKVMECGAAWNCGCGPDRPHSDDHSYRSGSANTASNIFMYAVISRPHTNDLLHTATGARTINGCCGCRGMMLGDHGNMLVSKVVLSLGMFGVRNGRDTSLRDASGRPVARVGGEADNRTSWPAGSEQ